MVWFHPIIFQRNNASHWHFLNFQTWAMLSKAKTFFSAEIPQHHISLCRGPSWKYKIKNKVDYKTDPDDDDNFRMMMLTMIWILAMTTSNSMLIVTSSTAWLLFGYLCWLPLITQILSGSLLNRKTGYSNAMHEWKSAWQGVRKCI